MALQRLRVGGEAKMEPPLSRDRDQPAVHQRTRPGEAPGEEATRANFERSSKPLQRTVGPRVKR
jgi:hypothetical protein